MSVGLGLPVTYIKGIARKASHAYKVYTIPKRNGDLRTIHHPSRALKALQRWLLGNYIQRWPVHDAAYAYIRGRNIGLHAAAHAHSKYLLRLDLESFFPSITETDIRAFLTTRPDGIGDWEDDDIDLFVSLVCRKGRLTIGAPTSPALSNVLCFELDARLSELATRKSARYTRFADDLFFSATRPNVLGDIPLAVRQVLGKLAFPSRLSLNEAKTRHSSRKRRRQVTGLVLASDGRAVLGRKRKRFIRRQIHRLPQLDQTERSQLRGLIAFGMSIEPGLLDALIVKYGHKQVIEAWKGSIS